MALTFALILSVVLQFGAVFTCLSLINKTKLNVSWLSISLAFLLMAVRRSIELYQFLYSSKQFDYQLTNSWIAVFISFLIFLASFYIKRFFLLQSSIEKIKLENEIKILSATIKTEEKERVSFAKELHDGLGPILSAVEMAISSIDKTKQSENVSKILSHSESSVEEAINCIKEISNKLSPRMIEEKGLEYSLENHFLKLKEMNHIQSHFTSGLNNKRLNPDLEITLFRIVSELSSNTLKHANASRIDCSINCWNNELELIYNDNGKGFDLKAIPDKSLGLYNIQSRVKSLRGKIDILSKPTLGFFVKIKFPV